jgi:hypothetical protein
VAMSAAMHAAIAGVMAIRMGRGGWRSTQ